MSGAYGSIGVLVVGVLAIVLLRLPGMIRSVGAGALGRLAGRVTLREAAGRSAP